jgi:hypothetical protein
MPHYDANQEEDAHSYCQRTQDLNENPAIAAYYFQKRWQVFFEDYLKPILKVKDFWWRFEWQHRGSSHVHGFFWLEDAPSIDDLDLNKPEDLAKFVDYWDSRVSTWHPDSTVPPAAIHPSAMLFNTLADTKLELAQVLNRFQRHTRCVPGYCEHRNKETGNTFCRFGFPKQCRNQTEYAKDPQDKFADIHTR